MTDNRVQIGLEFGAAVNDFVKAWADWLDAHPEMKDLQKPKITPGQPVKLYSEDGTWRIAEVGEVIEND